MSFHISMISRFLMMCISPVYMSKNNYKIYQKNTQFLDKITLDQSLFVFDLNSWSYINRHHCSSSMTPFVYQQTHLNFGLWKNYYKKFTYKQTLKFVNCCACIAMTFFHLTNINVRPNKFVSQAEPHALQTHFICFFFTFWLHILQITV